MEDNFKKTEYHLYNYKDIDKLNKIDEIKIRQLENDITLSAVQYDKDSISQTNAFHSSVEDEVIRRDEHIKNKIDHLKADIVKRNLEKELIEAAIDILKDDERRLIELRYFSNPTNQWNSIALNLNVTYDACMKNRYKIINKISDYIN
ncbi:xanthine dehydrogenase [Clostridium beijerinckii]|uniref:xanthine dehydrogenase n=1 Tax=Clostridium beijerinckii TaxID=1520 RepID=UPI00232D10CC|nr:xanthine dehydrogenase [Clostridium beijerinckii]